MIVGVEGEWEWTSYSGEVLTLNERDAWPRYKIDRIPNLYAAGDFAAESDAATLRTGEVPREGERTGKTLTFEGRVQAQTLDELRDAISAFQAAFYDTGMGTMLAGPATGYTGTLDDRTFTARAIEAGIEEEQTTSPNGVAYGYERVFSVSLRMADPRYYFTTEEADEDDTLIEQGSEGWAVIPGDPLVPESTEGITLVTTNPGNAPVDPLLRIEGPVTNPVVKNSTIDRMLRFHDFTMVAGRYLWIDFRARRIYRNDSPTDPYATTDGADNRKLLDASSTWWNRGTPGLKPGANTLKLRGHTVSAGASLKVIYVPADAA